MTPPTDAKRDSLQWQDFGPDNMPPYGAPCLFETNRFGWARWIIATRQRPYATGVKIDWYVTAGSFTLYGREIKRWAMLAKELTYA